VNDKAGARTPLALVFASLTLALCLLFLTDLLANLPKAVLAAVVLTAVAGPRKMILLPSLYSFGPDLFQALHGASMRHSLNVLAEQVKLWPGPSSAVLGTVAPINNTNAINMVECRVITASLKVSVSENNECTAFPG
jgi:hypothetical protein